MDSGGRELLFIGCLMIVLFAFALLATVLFIRQWRKENKKDDREV